MIDAALEWRLAQAGRGETSVPEELAPQIRELLTAAATACADSIDGVNSPQQRHT